MREVLFILNIQKTQEIPDNTSTHSPLRDVNPLE